MPANVAAIMMRLARRARRPPQLLLVVIAALVAGLAVPTGPAGSLAGALPEIHRAGDGEVWRSTSAWQLGRLAVCLDDDGPDQSGDDDDDGYAPDPPRGTRLSHARDKCQHGPRFVAADWVDSDSRGPPFPRPA